MEQFNQLESEFNKSKNNFDEFLKEAEEISEKKIFSKGFILNVRDYEKESMGFKKGKELKDLPNNSKDVFVYYFNNANKIILIDTYGATPNIIDKEFCKYETDGLKTYYFSGGMARLRNITLSQNENLKTKKVFNYGVYGISVKDYVYDKNGILEKILVNSKQHDKVEFEPHELLFTFEAAVLVKIVQSYPNGYKKEIYK